MNQLWQWFFGSKDLRDVGPIRFEDCAAVHDLLTQRGIYFERSGSDLYGARFLVDASRIQQAQADLEALLGCPVSVCQSYSTGDF